MKSHRHHNRKMKHNTNNNSKWYRRHQKWLKQHKSKSHHKNRHSSLSRSGHRINPIQKSNMRSSPTYVQAHVSFYDSNFDDTLKSNRFTSSTNYRNGDKWPHLARLQSQLHQDMLGDSLPPYIKKYSRRNKQLISLLEGQGMPNIDNELNNNDNNNDNINNNNNNNNKEKLHLNRRQKEHDKWIEKNLFEEQINDNKTKMNTASLSSDIQQQPIVVNSKQRYLNEKNLQTDPNGIPGEHLSLSSEEYTECEYDDCSVKVITDKKINRKISPKADSFLFHRVATPKLVGTASIGGGLIKQKLPFVALTDKRIEDGVRQRRTNIVQNTFPLP